MRQSFHAFIIKLLIALTCLLSLAEPSAYAESGIRIGPDGKVLPHRLESLELRGTTRMTAAQLREELNLKEGISLDDQLVMTTRQKLLSLGLFSSAILYQRRGTKPGLVKLIVEVEDEESVLTDWALGGEVGITFEQTQLSATDPDTPPLGYKVHLIGRNIFNSLHRTSLFADIDSEGTIREGRAVYGLPRFAVEDVQFDFEVNAVDVHSRYLNAMGYGGRLLGLWTRSLGHMDLFYGPAMYFNREPRFAFPSFPKSTTGPKLGVLRETRLIRFFPGRGYKVAAAAMYSVIDSSQSILELEAAYTFDLASYLYLTLDSKFLSVGTKGYSFRGESRVDIPIGPATRGTTQQANLFMRLRSGADEYESTHLLGSSAIFGIRYHSLGFIAEVAFEITRSPDSFVDGVSSNDRESDE